MKMCYVFSVLVVVVMIGVVQVQILVKLGVLNDWFGVYFDFIGEGLVIVVCMVVEDFKVAEKGIKVDVVVADYQNKLDIGVSIVW